MSWSSLRPYPFVASVASSHTVEHKRVQHILSFDPCCLMSLYGEPLRLHSKASSQALHGTKLEHINE